MLYYPIENYEDFKKVFGIVEHGNGEKSRRNKILLSVLKQKELLHDVVINKNSHAKKLLNCRDMSLLFTSLTWLLSERPHEYRNRIVLMNYAMYSKDYELDDMKGLCEDGDYTSVRYVNNSGRVYKMRIGKFIRKIILDSDYYKYWSEQSILWYCEEFARSWKAYTSQAFPNYKLVVNKDFDSIYNEVCLVGDFHSCMVNEDVGTFYLNCVEARAASLRDEDGMIVARCVIFDKVFDEENGKVYRLAERQYAKNESELLKRVLVNKLISADEIDGYKRIGADCHSPQSFVTNNGDSIYHDMHIDVNISDRNIFIPYMDSFKYYEYEDEICRNYDGYEDYIFEETNGRPWDENYDEYHDRYTEDEVRVVYFRGREMSCSEEDMDDFRYVENRQEYHHEDDVRLCDECGVYELEEDCYYSDITEEWYCSEYCRDNAEDQYKERYWYYSVLLDEYYECEDYLEEAESEWYENHGYVYSEVTEEWYENEEELEKAEEEFNKE